MDDFVPHAFHDDADFGCIDHLRELLDISEESHHDDLDERELLEHSSSSDLPEDDFMARLRNLDRPTAFPTLPTADDASVSLSEREEGKTRAIGSNFKAHLFSDTSSSSSSSISSSSSTSIKIMSATTQEVHNNESNETHLCYRETGNPWAESGLIVAHRLSAPGGRLVSLGSLEATTKEKVMLVVEWHAEKHHQRLADKKGNDGKEQVVPAYCLDQEVSAFRTLLESAASTATTPTRCCRLTDDHARTSSKTSNVAAGDAAVRSTTTSSQKPVPCLTVYGDDHADPNRSKPLVQFHIAGNLLPRSSSSRPTCKMLTTIAYPSHFVEPLRKDEPKTDIMKQAHQQELIVHPHAVYLRTADVYSKQVTFQSAPGAMESKARGDNHHDSPRKRPKTIDRCDEPTGDISREILSCISSISPDMTSKGPVDMIAASGIVFEKACLLRESRTIQRLARFYPNFLTRPIPKDGGMEYPSTRSYDVRTGTITMKRTSPHGWFKYPLHAALFHQLDATTIESMVRAAPTMLLSVDGQQQETPLHVLLRGGHPTAPCSNTSEAPPPPPVDEFRSGPEEDFPRNVETSTQQRVSSDEVPKYYLEESRDSEHGIARMNRLVDFMLLSDLRVVSQVDRRGNTPLHTACQWGPRRGGISMNAIRHLHWLYPSAAHKRNRDGNVPLQLAQRCCRLGHDGERKNRTAAPNTSSPVLSTTSANRELLRSANPDEIATFLLCKVASLTVR